MTAQQDLLRPYLPRLVTQWLAEAPDDVHREIEGSIAFVDISGFTRLSERLAKRGKVGAEELTDAIGACFARLLGVAYGNGGGLIKFGGDALLLLFTGTDHNAKACRAAIGMRRALREIGSLACPGGRVTLRMSTGVHSGTFHFFLVGGTHRELIITGPAASETVFMEATAEAGEIVVSSATAAALPQNLLGGEKGSGRLLQREPPGLTAERTDLDDAKALPDLLPCIPAAIRTHLLAGLDEPEHKRVTVAFIHFDGTDALIERLGADAARHLDELVRDVQNAVDRHGICFLGTDIDRDGGKIIVTAGAPDASENDEERMLLALREIMGGSRTIPVRAGVNRGYVFAGNVGPPYRRTYTVMGDAVNLAARLMAKAQPGQILATEAVLEQSHTGFESAPLEPFTVKGKAEPVVAFDVGAATGPKRVIADVRGPLVGRDAEMAALLDALASARQGRGRIVSILGDPGIGKTRLLEELRALTGPVRVLSASCELYESSTPYFPFRTLLRDLLDITDELGADAAAERLLGVIENVAPELKPWAPLLAIPLDLDVPATPETELLEEKFRRSRLEEATHDLLVALVREPTVFAIEDVHWMDEASADLLRRLASDLAGSPWLICVTGRETGDGFTVPKGAQAVTVRPCPLDEHIAATLIDALTEESPFVPHDVAALARRSGGNPLFLRELLEAARATGGLEGLPESVEGLITARIDRLAPQERSMLRRVSVLGPSFTRELAKAVLSDTPSSDGEPNWKRLSEFLTLDGPAALRFRSALIRDAAYEGLSFRLRQTLHALVGETIEREAADRLEDQAELLSLHFFYARRYEPAWRYSRMAAERARSIYANVVAAEFFERALEAGRGQAFADDREIAAVFEALGDVRRRIGEFAKAEEAYRRGRRLKRADPAATARLLLKQADARQASGHFTEAIRFLGRAERTISADDVADAAKLRAQVAVTYAAVRKVQGRLSDVIESGLRAVTAAKEAGDKEALAHAYYLLDSAYVELGMLDKATMSSSALAIYEELGDLSGQGVVLNNLGTQAYWQGRWNEAVELYDRGRVAKERIGDAWFAATGTMNIGEILSDQGRPDEAEPLFRKALRVWKAAGDRVGVAYALMNLGRLAARSGRFEEAMLLLERARDDFGDAGASVDIIETDARIAEALILQGEAKSGLSVAERALAATSGPATQTAMLRRIQGWALEQLGDLDGARTSFEQSLDAGRSRDMDYEVAQTLRAIARLSERNGAPDRAAQAESEAIFERLGVVRVSDPPAQIAEPQRVTS